MAVFNCTLQEIACQKVFRVEFYSCAFALLVAVLSVSIQIIKAVRTNPVESIKTE